MSRIKQEGVKELTDINYRELATEINEVLTRHVGGRLWTEIVGFSKLPKHAGGGSHQDQWQITLNVEDQEILGRSDKPSIYGDDPLFGTSKTARS